MAATGGLIHRVIVRGRFTDDSPRVRAMLAANLEEHGILKSAFTDEGTLTYDERLSFFSFRYEIRHADDDADAERVAIARATEFLRVLGVGHTIAKASAMDLTSLMSR